MVAIQHLNNNNTPLSTSNSPPNRRNRTVMCIQPVCVLAHVFQAHWNSFKSKNISSEERETCNGPGGKTYEKSLKLV